MPIHISRQVFSIDSGIEFDLDLPAVARPDKAGGPPVTSRRRFAGSGSVHAEKSWGYGFPRAWSWAQGRRVAPGDPPQVGGPSFSGPVHGERMPHGGP